MFLPFRNVTRAAAHDWLVVGGPLVLGETLGQFRDLSVVPEEVLSAARRRIGLASDSSPDTTQLRRLAEETDGWTAVTGNVIASGTRIRISVQALDVPTARVLHRADADVASDADVREAIAKLGVRLLEITGVPSTTGGAAALSTQSAAAYRAYVEGIAFLQQSAFRRAQQKLEEAVRLDSTFALAWSRLAVVSIGWNPEAILAPGGLAYRAIEQAARNAHRLPSRQVQVIRSQQALLQGQTRRSRQIADSLVASDRTDVDALELLVLIEMLDPRIDTAAAVPRLASSWNRMVTLARELLERDPGRRYAYSALAYVYGITGGLWGGAISGVRTEGGSLAAMLVRSPDVLFAQILRDSIESVPMAEFEKLPPAERERLRRRGAEAANEWINRWIAAAGADADAHLWASRAGELLSDDRRALAEAVIADSLGVDSPMENTAGRRLSLDLRLGDFRRGAALADSLLASGALATRPFRAVLDRRRANSVAAFVLAKRWDRLAALGDALGARADGQPSCASLAEELTRAPLSSVQAKLRIAIMDTVATNFGAATSVPALARCVESLATGLWTDSTTARRTFAGGALMAAADSLARSSDMANAYRAARVAWAADTSRRSAIVQRQWFLTRSRELALGARFAVDSVIVDGDSAAFTLSLTGSEPLVIDSPGLATNWFFGLSMRNFTGADSGRFGVDFAHTSPPTERGATGGLPELIAALNQRGARFTFWRGAMPQPPPAILTLTAVGREIRVAARGPAIAALRRLGPTTATVSTSPCIAVTGGLCSPVTIPVVYPQPRPTR